MAKKPKPFEKSKLDKDTAKLAEGSPAEKKADAKQKKTKGKR